MKFEESEIYDKLTIIITTRNVVDLHYTFIESLWSAIPLGCRFLVGNFQFETNDNQIDYYNELSKYVPMKIVNKRWRGECGLTAIGLATQDLINESETEYVYNLQACEILCETTPKTIIDIFKSPELDTTIPIMQFKHFFGSCKFEGTIGGHAYNYAQRLMHKTADTSQGDGCAPIINKNRNGFTYLGMVHRYSYCFQNQINKKVHNHSKFFGQNLDQQFKNLEWCRQNPNYNGPHPHCVRHIIDKNDYDSINSLNAFKNSHIKL